MFTATRPVGDGEPDVLGSMGILVVPVRVMLVAVTIPTGLTLVTEATPTGITPGMVAMDTPLGRRSGPGPPAMLEGSIRVVSPW